MSQLAPRIDKIEAISKLRNSQYSIAEVSTVSVPYTTILNRAKIPDLANDLKLNFGIERIPVQQIFQLQDEFGANGEPVFGAVNDYQGLIRLVGSWSTFWGLPGQGITTSTVNDYLEITFYGTGLSINVGAITGTGYHVSALNTWQTGNFFSHPSVTNWSATAGAVIRTAQWQLRLGARSNEEMRDSWVPFSQLDYEWCLRYFEKTFPIDVPVANNTGVIAGAVEGIAIVTNARLYGHWWYKKNKRTYPTMNTWSPTTNTSTLFTANPASPSFESFGQSSPEGVFGIVQLEILLLKMDTLFI